MSSVKKVETRLLSITEAGAVLGLDHLQSAALERALLQAGVMRSTTATVLTAVATVVEHARAKRGNPYASKLSPLQAQEIRRASKQGASYSHLAREFSVSSTSIRRICSGQAYAHIRPVRPAKKAVQK